MLWLSMLVLLTSCGDLIVVEPCGAGFERDADLRCVPKKTSTHPPDTDSGSTDTAESSPDSAAPTEPYHPEGYAGALVHGPDTNLQADPCTECHGETLLGVDLDADGDIDARDGDCDVCHQPQWRDTCNYCHGDVDVESGAPPREIDRSTDPETFSFKAHTVHDTAGDSGPAYACSQCHSMPEDILSPGHIVVGDDTPGAAEVDFTGGLAPETAWDGATCSNVYCHGNGQSAAEVEHTAEPMNCDTSCHSGPGSPETDWRAMSGTHQIHLVSRDIRGECAVCHGETVSAEGTIIDMSKHINGRVDHSFTGRGEGVVWEGETCVGGCHYREISWDLLPPPP